jgi:hypothetical protein
MNNIIIYGAIPENLISTEKTHSKPLKKPVKKTTKKKSK